MKLSTAFGARVGAKRWNREDDRTDGWKELWKRKSLSERGCDRDGGDDQENEQDDPDDDRVVVGHPVLGHPRSEPPPTARRRVPRPRRIDRPTRLLT